MISVFPSKGTTGERFRLHHGVGTGREGVKVSSSEGWLFIISRWDGNGRETCREKVGNKSGKDHNYFVRVWF